MKKNITKVLSILFVSTLIAVSCTDEPEHILRGVDTFAPPVLTNPATRAEVELLPENADVLYETFEWEETDYGVHVLTNYVLQVDDDEEFSNPQMLATSTSSSTTVTVKRLNDAILGLGLPGFEEATVNIRLRSIISGYPKDTLYSNVIQRTVTTYQVSDCGNFCTIGLIGDATPGGWDTDTDMRLVDATRVDKYNWTVTLYLTAGNAKFRASDDWATAWGSTDFPSGIGSTVGGSPDIPIATPGYYRVTLNDQTGAYSFTALTAPEYPTIGLVGDATPGGWDTDTDLTQDVADPHIWTGTITLTSGNVKFRADDAWTVNWGATTFPSGYGTGGGPDIPVTSGTYFVRFNDVTGEYSFMNTASSTAHTLIGIVGDATPGGWDVDTDMIRNPTNPFLWSKIVTITDGYAKFRADDAWTISWGASAFPSGVGSLGGPDIPVSAGVYFVTFNTGTGEYYFLK